MRKHELLSPAGSLEICKAVLNAGADAVYLGGDKFGARAFAKNFTQNDIQEALDFAHMRGKKIFLTVNTLLKNKEIETELFSYLKPLYEHGLDAVIVQDYGVFQFVHRNFPELALHASTQMSVSNVSGAKFLMEHGAERIVTARELSRSEIRRIYDETGVEIEIHGALCYCYSGQCLMSSMLGGRSGNRGRCAQPCRLAYQVTDERGNLLHKKEKYPLSPKDLCTISQLPQLCESGIYSFKIEGRMKKLEYAAGVTSIYRKYLDLYESCPEHYRVEDADMERLLAFGNRNGFTAGYYDMRNGRSMMTLTDSSHSSNEAKAAYQAPEETKVPVELKAVFHAGEPMQLEAALSVNDTEAESHSDKKVCVTGEIPGTAQNRPLSKDELRKRLSKTGDTPFYVQHLEIDLEDGLFVPVGQINELRRNALEQLQEAVLGSWRRNEVVTLKKRSTDGMRMKQNGAIGSGDKPMLNVWLTGSALQHLGAVLENQTIDMVTLEGFANLEAAVKEIHAAGKQAGYAFPYVLRENSEGLLRKQGSVLKQFDRIWVRSYDGIGFAKEELYLPAEKLALDAGLYVFSNEAAADFMADGFAGYTASMELNRKELAHMENKQAELMLYGYAPLMISAQCVYKNYASCIREQKKESGKQSQRLYLNDRYQKQFEVQRDCTHCYNVIYNSQSTYLLHHADEISGLDFGAHRIVFRNESAKQMHGILQQYEDAFRSGRKIQPPKEGTYTNGHFRRGVD